MFSHAEQAELVARAYQRVRATKEGHPLPALPFGAVSTVCDWEYLQFEVVAGTVDPRLVHANVPGTNELADWTRSNFRRWPQRILDTPGRWTAGAREGGEYVWSRLRPEMDARGTTRATIGGHSMGAAIACAVVSYAKGTPAPGGGRYRVEAACFGGPGICTPAAARFIHGRVTQYSLGFDIVARIAPPWYRRPGERIHLAPKTFVQAWKEEGLQLVGDHSMELYAAAMSHE